MATLPNPDELISRLPEGPRSVIKCVIERGGWLYGSTVRVLIRNETHFTDFDLILPPTGKLDCLKGHTIERGFYCLNEWDYHALERIPAISQPMFDVDMLAISKTGLSVRPLGPLEQQYACDLELIVWHVRQKQFAEYPTAKTRSNYERKRNALISAGWTPIN